MDRMKLAAAVIIAWLIGIVGVGKLAEANGYPAWWSVFQ